jgi:hypothetical protein
MLIADMWKINRTRSGGRFNLYFFWMYPLAAPFCFMWDLLCWLERAATPTEKRS